MSGIERLAKTISADMERRLPGQRKTQRSKLSLLVARPGLRMNDYGARAGNCRTWSRKSGFQLAVLRRVFTLPLALLARTRPRAKRRTIAMLRAPCPPR